MRKKSFCRTLVLSAICVFAFAACSDEPAGFNVTYNGTKIPLAITVVFTDADGKLVDSPGAALGAKYGINGPEITLETPNFSMAVKNDFVNDIKDVRVELVTETGKDGEFLPFPYKEEDMEKSEFSSIPLDPNKPIQIASVSPTLNSKFYACYGDFDECVTPLFRPEIGQAHLDGIISVIKSQYEAEANVRYTVTGADAATGQKKTIGEIPAPGISIVCNQKPFTTLPLFEKDDVGRGEIAFVHYFFEDKIDCAATLHIVL